MVRMNRERSPRRQRNAGQDRWSEGSVLLRWTLAIRYPSDRQLVDRLARSILALAESTCRRYAAGGQTRGLRVDLGLRSKTSAFARRLQPLHEHLKIVRRRPGAVEPWHHRLLHHRLLARPEAGEQWPADQASAKSTERSRRSEIPEHRDGFLGCLG